MAKRPRVVIVGGGFGGTYTARFLKRAVGRKEVDITIINRTNYFLFTPLLHEVATGGLSVTSVAEPLREIFSGSGITIHETMVTKIDPPRRVVKTAAGEISYDYLVISPGAETNFYDVPGAEKYGLVLKNLFDAVSIRQRVIENFERAANVGAEERAKLLSFVVVGGGATGVELAAELAELIYDTLCRYYGRHETICRLATVALVSSDRELLTKFPLEVRRTAWVILERKGIKLKLGSAVTLVTADRIEFADGSIIPTTTIFWMAGVKPSPLDLPGAVYQPDGRIKIDNFLQATGLERTFVIGDAAYFVGDNGVGQPLPMLAQVAVAQARILTKNILATIAGKPLRPFRYHSKGVLISLGRWFAAGEIFGFSIRGRLAWWLWRTVYLFKFHSWRKRLLIAIEWTINLFSSRDITKVR